MAISSQDWRKPRATDDSMSSGNSTGRARGDGTFLPPSSVCGIADPHGGSRVLGGNLPDAEMLRLLDESMQ